MIHVWLYNNGDPRVIMTIGECNILVQNHIQIDVHLRSEPSDSDVDYEERSRETRAEIRKGIEERGARGGFSEYQKEWHGDKKDRHSELV